MRRLLLSLIAAGCLLTACCGSASAQAAPPPTEKAPEPKKAERDGSSVAVSYMLAAIGVIIVMVLVCMPARRE